MLTLNGIYLYIIMCGFFAQNIKKVKQKLNG